MSFPRWRWGSDRDTHLVLPGLPFLFPLWIGKISCNSRDGEQGWGSAMTFTLEVEKEDDGRWIAEVDALAGVLAYGATRAEAIRRAEALALRVLADRLEHGENVPEMGNVFTVSP